MGPRSLDRANLPGDLIRLADAGLKGGVLVLPPEPLGRPDAGVFALAGASAENAASFPTQEPGKDLRILLLRGDSN
jgi:hypothetical protein